MKYVSYWHEVGGAGIWCSRRTVSCRANIGLLSVESYCIRSMGNSGSVFLLFRVTFRAGLLFGRGKIQCWLFT